MSGTTIPFGSPLAAKKWGTALYLDSTQKSYFGTKFTGKSENSIIQLLTELENDAGDEITFDLSLQLRGKPTYGDNRLEGKEESLKFASDSIFIDQMRHGVSAGGKMTRQRTVHDLRRVGRDRLSDFWAKIKDEMTFIYLSGARGINEDYQEGEEWAGHANNPIQTPDADHLITPNGHGKATLVAGDIMTKKLIEAVGVTAGMMRARAPKKANMQPVSINGSKHFVMVMSPYQEHQLKNESTSGWMEIQRAAAASEGRNNPIFKGGLGMIDGIVLHSHANVIRFDDYGSTGNLPAARALFMGAQAGVQACGGSDKMRMT